MLGCDLHCAYCQNWVTSQALRDEAATSDIRRCAEEDLVELSLRNNVPVMVSTYNEPLITADWSVRIFEKAREAGIVCGFVSNGNATPEVLEFLRPFVSLYKVDLKGFDDKRYRSLGCVLSNVLKSIERLKEMGVWVEIVTLVVPGFNDGEEELRSIAHFIAGVSVDIPWHITAFHPDYKLTHPPRTSVQKLTEAYDLGKEAGLRFVYPGNVPGAFGDRENTRCPSCNALIIERQGFYVHRNHMNADRCPSCNHAIPGVWQENPPRESVGSGMPIPVSI